MNNPFNRIRWKILWLFFMSLVLSAITTLFIFLIMLWIYRLGYSQLRPFLRLIDQSLGLIPAVSISATVFFIIFVILFSWRHIRYLGEITDAVKILSQGKLNTQIPVKTHDELGELAMNINQMTKQLNTSIEEERHAVKAKNELITNVSHDLRTPLTSIVGYLQLIDDDRYKDEVELRYYVHIVHEKAQRLNRLVHDLFEYTRMGYGQTVLERNQIDLSELIGQVAADFSLQIQDKDMKLDLELPEEKVILTADGDKLMRVFDNLISNAIKYGKEGKKIEIGVKRENEYVIIRVINYGIPIPTHDLPHIFERFYRTEKSRSDETGGSGLGLAIVKSIIDLHEGTITLISDERETAFEVRLPMKIKNHKE